MSRTFADAFGWEFKTVPVANILNQCTHTINYCPMAACMFLALRLRVVWLSQGAEWDPQDWVCVCMQYVAWSILATTLVVALIPLFTGEFLKVDAKTGDLDAATKGFTSPMLAMGFTALRYAILVSSAGSSGGLSGSSASSLPRAPGRTGRSSRSLPRWPAPSPC